jgi:signal transduction histidine kinase
MTEPDGRASILIVDDKRETTLALEAILEDLGQRIVTAHSGREALRHLLNEEFAVILLDVNMPDMDGFEAASLIRQRTSLQHVPIIFITALGDEMHMARGYRLGAVDYILAPVVREVLRSKVSVFVELYQKTAQVRRQSDTLRRRATQLQKLAAASLSINSAVAIEQMMQNLAASAGDILSGDQALALLYADPTSVKHRLRSATYFAERYSKWREREINLESLTSTVIAQSPTATRLSASELHDHPDWDTIRALKIPAIQSCLLAAPLTDRCGKNLGLVLLLDNPSGKFTADEETILMQLVQITSIAIQNAIFAWDRQANRLKDEFLATLSHELRTPLNAIVGWTRLLRMEKLPDEAVRGLDVIDRNVRAQTKLIEDLLDVSRITTGKFRLNQREVALAPIVQAAIDSIAPAAKARGILVKGSLDQHVRAFADPDRLQQVVWNLLSNAVKFTPEKGRVDVVLEKMEAQARIRVSDTGQGIDPDFVRFVFDRFRQADGEITRSHGGLGIGLNIVRHIIELHGGAVAAHSAGLGRGATFTVTLPTLIPEPTDETPAADNGEDDLDLPPVRTELPIKLTGKRVLLVDDQMDARDVVCEILRRADADVTTAKSAREALDYLAKNMPDVLVSDLAMPGLDGYSLLETLRQFPAEQGGQTPAIALTAYAREEDRLRALGAGFQVHLCKPVEPRQLVTAIADLTHLSDGENGKGDSDHNNNGGH